LKQIIVILFLVVLSVVVIGSFVGGVIYAEKTSRIPKDGNFEMDGYFTNIQKSDLKLFDDEYPYFTNGTGASKKEAEDYKNNPDNYTAYEVELVVKNVSNYDICCAWAVLQGYQANYEKVIPKSGHSNYKRNVWLNCWLSEGATSLQIGETFNTMLHIIVKTVGKDENEIQKLLENLQINLQLGISEESLNPQFDISRNISFNYPVFYKKV
jgi:hypothetical protein